MNQPTFVYSLKDTKISELSKGVLTQNINMILVKKVIGQIYVLPIIVSFLPWPCDLIYLLPNQFEGEKT